VGKHHVAARSKRVDPEDEPTFEPMGGRLPSVIRRAPSSDQKKIRRQMAQSQEQSMQSAPQKTASTEQAADTTISPRQREVDLLQAMAAASTLQTQRTLAAELENLRSERISTQRYEASLNFESQAPQDRWSHNPNPGTIRTSMASDWIMDVEAPEHTAMERDQKMVAEASMWFTRTAQAIRDDHEEFAIQAIGMSAHLASQFGEDAGVAQRTFLDHVGHLAGHTVANDMLTTPNNDTITAPLVESEPMDDINAPAPTGDAEVAHSDPSDNLSLGEGNEPAGDGGGDPISDSAVENNAGDSGDATPTVDNTPASPTVLPPSGTVRSMGAKRQALMERLAVAWARRHYEDLASTIATHPERDQLAKHFADHLMGTNPHYRRDQFQQAAGSKGYQVRGGVGTANYSRGHYQHVANAIASYPGDKDSVAKHFADHFAQGNPKFDSGRFVKATQSMSAPKAAAASPWSGEANDEEVSANSPSGAGRQYQVSFTHPSGAKHSETVSVPAGHGPEHAIQKVRSQFRNADEAANANWKVDMASSPWSGQANNESIRNNSAKTAVTPEPDGLNSGVDFTPIADPNDSVSLGPGDEGEWPDAPDGDPQTMSSPETPGATKASLYDARTDQMIATASRDHELAASASRSGTIWVDGDLMVIAAEIASEDYVQTPVREVYVGMDA